MNSFIRGLDAAVTFDFQSQDLAAAARTEAQALFFLAGWRRYCAGRLPLRLVCVSEPPDTVLSLADRCRATVDIRNPLVLENGAIFNRALAWAGAAESDRQLVLAPDVLVLRDFTRTLETLPIRCLSMAPAEKSQLSNADWEKIYRYLDVPLPAERMTPLRVELGLPVKGVIQTFPYYHGAVTLAPRSCEFGTVWTEHVEKLADVLPNLESITPRLGAKLAANGKVALATACQALLARGDGVFQRLPPACDGRFSYFESAVYPGPMDLLHASGLFNNLIDLSQIQEGLHAYAILLRAAVENGVRRRGGGHLKARLVTTWRTRAVESSLRKLYLDEVRPTLRRCGAYG